MSNLAVVPVLLFSIIFFGVADDLFPFSAIRDKIVVQRRENIKSRQSGWCPLPPSTPEQCKTAFDDLDGIFNISSFEELNLEELDAAFDVVCTDVCVGSEIEFYECLGEPDLADFVNDGICGESNGINCLVLWIEGIINSTIVMETTCTLNGSCDTQCGSSLQRTADFLGCCVASLFDNSVSVFFTLISPGQFEACDVEIGQACPGVSGSRAASVGLHLLTILAAAVALVNCIPF